MNFKKTLEEKTAFAEAVLKKYLPREEGFQIRAAQAKIGRASCRERV